MGMWLASLSYPYMVDIDFQLETESCGDFQYPFKHRCRPPQQHHPPNSPEASAALSEQR